MCIPRRPRLGPRPRLDPLSDTKLWADTALWANIPSHPDIETNVMTRIPALVHIHCPLSLVALKSLIFVVGAPSEWSVEKKIVLAVWMVSMILMMPSVCDFCQRMGTVMMADGESRVRECHAGLSAN